MAYYFTGGARATHILAVGNPATWWPALAAGVWMALQAFHYPRTVEGRRIAGQGGPARTLALQGGFVRRNQSANVAPGPVLRYLLEGLLRPHPPAADLVDALIGEDSGRPGERVAAGTVALARQVDLHERLLHRIEGVLVVA